MRLVLIAPLTALSLLGGLHASQAANARNPYSNIDPRNDAGNDTGDSRVERLNQAQLQHGPALRYPAAPYGYRYARPAYPHPYGYGY